MPNFALDWWRRLEEVYYVWNDRVKIEELCRKPDITVCLPNLLPHCHGEISCGLASAILICVEVIVTNL